MIYDQSAIPLLEKLRAANDAEGEAIRALHSYMKGGGRDEATLSMFSLIEWRRHTMQR